MCVRQRLRLHDDTILQGTQLNQPIHTHSVDSKKRKNPETSSSDAEKSSVKKSKKALDADSSKSSIFKFFKKPLFAKNTSSQDKSVTVAKSVLKENKELSRENAKNVEKMENKDDIVADTLKDMVNKITVTEEKKSSPKEEKATQKKKKMKNGVEKVQLPPPQTKISIQEKNPKKSGSKSAARYDVYKTAKTIAEFYSLGGKKADARYDLGKGYMKIVGPIPVAAEKKNVASSKSSIKSFVKKTHNITKDNLPEGWKRIEKERGGNGGAKGTYFEFLAPDGSKHRSILSVLRHLGLVEQVETTKVSKPKKELPPHPRLKEFEELLSKLSKESVDLVREKSLRQQGQDLLRNMSDTLWRSIRENHSENPIDALKPLVGILLADRDTKTNDSTELAKIVLDEMKSCESRYASTGTVTSEEFFNRISMDSIVSMIPLMSEVKAYVMQCSSLT